MQRYSISGEVKGKFMRGLYAKVAIKVRKQDIHGSEIRSLRRHISEIQGHVILLKKELDTADKNLQGLGTEITLYQRYINERQATIIQIRDFLASVELRK